jgi:hypothetical protein
VKDLFDNLVKIGNNNPQLRDDIAPILHYLKKTATNSRGKQGTHDRREVASIAKSVARKFDGVEFSEVTGSTRGKYEAVWNIDSQERGEEVVKDLAMKFGDHFGAKPHNIDDMVGDGYISVTVFVRE